jgi:uncharacterized cupredoxin-like copper-binding protein
MNRVLNRWFRVACLTAACASLFLVTSCDDDSTTVNVTLDEYTVTLDRATAPHGDVTFDVSNAGTQVHEFLVIKTDLAPANLPTEDNGSYQEDGPGTDLIDEIEAVLPGESKDLTLNLSAGKYVLICNMVHTEGDVVEAHYSLGMRTAFTVQ